MFHDLLFKSECIAGIYPDMRLDNGACNIQAGQTFRALPLTFRFTNRLLIHLAIGYSDLPLAARGQPAKAKSQTVCRN